MKNIDLKLIVAVAIAYFVTGRLGLLLAIPPGYATAIWPPTGIALAAYLLFGKRSLPGIYLGSFLVNFSLGYNPDNILESAFTPFLIGFGACAHVVLGAFMINKFGTFVDKLEHYKEIFSLQFFGGFVGSVASATVGSAVLVLTNKTELSSYLANWFTWWIGDAIGVLIFTPSILHFAISFKQKSFKRFFYVNIPLFLSFCVSVFIFVMVSFSEESNIQKIFERKSKTINEQIHSELNQYKWTVESIGNFLANSDDIREDEFRGFVSPMLKNHPGIRALEWAPIIKAGQRKSFEERASQKLGHKFEIVERNSEGKLVRAKSRSVHVPVYLIEPLKGNENALGFDLSSNLNRLNAMREAEARKGIVATEPVNLVQNSGHDGRAFLLFNPYFKKGELKGYVVGVFDFLKILEKALYFNELNGVEFVLLEGSDEWLVNASSLLYETTKGLNKKIEAFTEEEKEKNVQIYIFRYAGKIWHIKVFRSDKFNLNYKSWMTWILLVAGLFLTGLLGGILLIVTGQTAQVERIVREKTKYLEESNSELIAANREIEKISNYKSRFLANMSHEIRTPLNGIVGTIDLMARKELDNETKENISVIQSASHLLIAIINDILDYSKLQEGKLNLRNERFKLKKTVTDVFKLFETTDKDIDFDLKLDDNLPQYIKSDKTRFTQVLSNLLSNAVKFTNRGRVTLSISKQIQSNGKIRIFCSISDTGIGVSDEAKSVLFSPFSQGDTSTTKKFGGSGLGLSICKSLVEKLGGEINFESQAGVGSTFYFYIVVDEYYDDIYDEDGTKVSDEDEKITSGFVESHPLKILVVEDNKINQKLISKILTKLGYQAELVENGAMAVDKVKHKSFDLIFMDIQMPVMDGIEATKLIRKEEKNRNELSVIVATTANAFDEDREKCINVGMNDFIAKPLKLDDVEQMILKYWNNKSSK